MHQCFISFYLLVVVVAVLAVLVQFLTPAEVAAAEAVAKLR
jgi:hypothetical protein